ARAGRRDLQGPHARRVGAVRARARLLPGAGVRARRGALHADRARARDGRRARTAGRRAPGAPAGGPGQALAHPRRARPPARPDARRAHRGGAARGRLLRGRDRRAPGERRGGGRGRGRAGDVPGMSATAPATAAGRQNGGEEPLLKMSELAERSGVSAGTIRYYLREGLLGEGDGIVRTSRNMAYYPASYVPRIEPIKRLQQQRYMPLRVIKGALEEDPERVQALVELEDRILERAVAGAEGRRRVSMKAAIERYGVPRNVLERLAEIGVLTPNRSGHEAEDV